MEWVPFDLHPEYPPEGIPRNRLEGRYGEDFSDHVQSMIETAGFKYAPPPVIPHSMPSLELAELARDEGKFEPVHVQLFDAYWSLGLDIGSPEVLHEIAAEAGLDAGKLDEVWGDGRYRERIASTTLVAQELGFGGVPAWLVDDRMMISGAQPHNVFESAMSQLGYEAASD
ncbi:MAG: DsbA family protein [Actinomycetota bacterium]|nr:DsbA family protein [Actinomycetota bacterium]